jgi:hypothetical protein
MMMPLERRGVQLVQQQTTPPIIVIGKFVNSVKDGVNI